MTKLMVASRMGDNGTSGSGFAELSDGRDYSFSWDPIEQACTLAGFVRMAGTSVRPTVVALTGNRSLVHGPLGMASASAGCAGMPRHKGIRDRSGPLGGWNG